MYYSEGFAPVDLTRAGQRPGEFIATISLFPCCYDAEPGTTQWYVAWLGARNVERPDLLRIEGHEPCARACERQRGFLVLSSYELTSRPHAIYYHQKNIVVYHSKIALRVKHHGNTLESMRVARGHPDPDVGVRRNHAVSSVRRTH
jgi:hypothetical protein